MKKNQSSGESSISQHYFAVYPLSLTFLKEYPSPFSFYYQKNLQIIAKHTIPPGGTLRRLSPPEALQHFRMASDKNLDYQWSLYRHGLQPPEEFIETQKITLKTQWSNYLENRQPVTESEVELRNIKCKLKYLVAIGKSNQDLLQKVQAYMQVKIATAPQEAPFNTVEQEEGEPPAAERNPEVEKIEVIDDPLREIPEEIIKMSEKLVAEEPMSSPPVLHQANNQPQAPASPPLDACRESLIPEEDMIKLSQSQLQICDQIEKEVNKYEQQMNESAKAEAAAQESLKPTEYHPSTRTMEITIIQSQMLNSKQEAIIPLWKSNKIIALALLLLALLAACLTVYFKGKDSVEGPKPIKERKGKKGGQKQGKQKVRNKEKGRHINN